MDDMSYLVSWKNLETGEWVATYPTYKSLQEALDHFQGNGAFIKVEKVGWSSTLVYMGSVNGTKKE